MACCALAASIAVVATALALRALHLYRRRLVARDQRVRPDRHHQRPHRGLQPTGQTGQTCRLRIPESRALGPPDTIPLHPQTAGRNPDLKLIARSKSKSRVSAPNLKRQPVLTINFIRVIHNEVEPTPTYLTWNEPVRVELGDISDAHQRHSALDLFPQNLDYVLRAG
jgi:hypothetical protein